MFIEKKIKELGYPILLGTNEDSISINTKSEADNKGYFYLDNSYDCTITSGTIKEEGYINYYYITNDRNVLSLIKELLNKYPFLKLDKMSSNRLSFPTIHKKYYEKYARKIDYHYCITFKFITNDSICQN